MSALRGQSVSPSPATKALAFYLPQYHPIPENDEWWGKGFTEWVNVTRARPLYPGHYQPHVPGELGYYDLRIPEVREAQADLARTHGISGFVYYHYWFHGKQLLHRPFDEVLASGAPDFPFALCWANEEWTRNWDGRSGTVLIPQEYSEKDDLDHIRWLATAFADHRYIKIDGRPLMLVYRPGLLPDSKHMTDRWRTEAQRLGIPDLYLCWVEGWGRPPEGPEHHGFDATVGFIPFSGQRLFNPVEDMRALRILDYASAYRARLDEPAPPWKHFPSVMVGWDSTARHPRNATIFEGATPEAYRSWLEETVASLAGVPDQENFLFLLAWNEWAEGNHLEPDQHFGRAFLEATRSVLTAPVDPARPGSPVEQKPVGADHPGGDLHDGVIASVAGLVETMGTAPPHLNVNLCVDSDFGSTILLSERIAFHALDNRPESVRRMKVAGIDATQCDITDVDAVVGVLNELGEVGAFLLLDAVGKMREPQRLLAHLSSWSLAHGDPPLFVTVPNVAHFDLALRLLFGEWDVSRSGALAGGQLRLFTEATLERLLERCGWTVIARDDVSSVQSSAYDPELTDSLPEEMIGALRVLSQTYNREWAVEQFVWALSPTEIDRPPESFTDAVGPQAEAPGRPFTNDQRRAVENYLASVGIIASETNRRGAALLRRPRPGWQQALRRIVDATPRTASVHRKARRGLD